MPVTPGDLARDFEEKIRRIEQQIDTLLKARYTPSRQASPIQVGVQELALWEVWNQPNYLARLRSDYEAAGWTIQMPSGFHDKFTFTPKPATSGKVPTARS